MAQAFFEGRIAAIFPKSNRLSLIISERAASKQMFTGLWPGARKVKPSRSTSELASTFGSAARSRSTKSMQTVPTPTSPCNPGGKSSNHGAQRSLIHKNHLATGMCQAPEIGTINMREGMKGGPHEYTKNPSWLDIHRRAARTSKQCAGGDVFWRGLVRGGLLRRTLLGLGSPIRFSRRVRHRLAGNPGSDSIDWHE